MVVLNAQTEDEAEYSCEISNKLGSAKSECSLNVLKGETTNSLIFLTFFTLIFCLDRFAAALHGEEALPTAATEGRRTGADHKLYPPGFLRQIKNKHVFTGFPAIFDCIVCGNPSPDVTW